MTHFAAHRACPQAHRQRLHAHPRPALTSTATAVILHMCTLYQYAALVSFAWAASYICKSMIKCAGALQLSTDLGLAMWRACSSRQSPATPRRPCERASTGSCPMGAMLAACTTAMGAQGTSPSPESARKCADMRVSQCSASSGSDGSCPAQPAQRMAS